MESEPPLAGAPALPPRPPPRPSTSPAVPPRPAPAAPPPPLRQATGAPASPLSSLREDIMYSLLRRWNRQVTHLRTAHVLPGRLDLSPSPDEQFQPEKLRSNVERVYLTVILSVVAFFKQMALLRSWGQPLRTAGFCIAYYIAWGSKVGVGAFLVILLALLVLFPSLRSFLFPPLPNPAETGAAEDVLETEREELEARNFTRELADLAGGPLQEEEQNTAATLVDIFGTANAVDVAGMTDAAEAPGESSDAPTVVKVDQLAKHGLPIQLLAGELADAWERWGNALSPTSPPFPEHDARIKVALCLLPIIIALLIVPMPVIARTASFALGFLFFGGPVLNWAGPKLDSCIEGNWREGLELRHSILNGVPCNTQLTLRLLRDAEAAGNPLPPPPPLTEHAQPLQMTPSPPPPPSRKLSVGSTLETPSASTLNLGRSDSHDSFDSTASPCPSELRQRRGASKASFASFVRSAARISEDGAGYISGKRAVNWEKISRMAVDKLKQATGSELPEHIMLVVPRSSPEEDNSRSTFYAHHRKVPGHLLIIPPSPKGEVFGSVLEFQRVGKAPLGDVPSDGVNLRIPIDDITELRRTAGLGWKGRMAAGWLMSSEAHVGNGIHVKWKDGETNFSVVVRRDELFNRLASIGPQTFCSL